MEKPIGISLEIGFDNSGSHCNLLKQRLQSIRPWTKQDGKWKIAPYGGFKFDLTIGTFRRPIPKFWKKEFWSRDYITKEQNTNPWNSDNYWFILSIPWFPSFFISCCYGKGEKQPGFYFGWKTYRIMDLSQGHIVECQLKQYMTDRNDKFIFDNDNNPILTWCNINDLGKTYTCLSASIRDDLIED